MRKNYVKHMSPIIFIIFGATGDLTSRKLMPAILRLYGRESLPKESYVIGIGRRDLTSDSFRDLMKNTVGSVQDKTLSLDGILQNMTYEKGMFEEKVLYERLSALLKAYDEKEGQELTRFFYLATPPEHYESILNNLRDSGLASLHRSNTRVLIEKPFGKDLETAQHLDQLLGTIFAENQIYRIDHYLAKETVQNILAFRFANGIFEPTWNSEFIDHVQITVAEDIGVEGRGSLYEGIGTLRDVVQNHMMQMLSLVAMEQPKAFDHQSIRDARVRVTSSIPVFNEKNSKDHVIRGQYEGYTQEKGVDPHSDTETFVALKLSVDTPRWRGVPFYLRTGKKMNQRTTEISIHYKKPALCYDDVCLFNPENVYRNVLTIRIQPTEEISVRLMVKEPGFTMNLRPVHMAYKNAESFSEIDTPDAYEKLLLDAMSGDQTLFARTDEIDASWKVFTPVLDAWKNNSIPLFTYNAATWGPKEGQQLIEKDGRHWYIYQR